jgi:hypothetical protein
MGRVPESKHAQIAEIVGKADRSPTNEKRDDAVRELIELCAQEIAEGLTKGGGTLSFGPPQAKLQAEIAATRRLAFKSAWRVVSTARDKRPANLPKYVQECAAEVARQDRAEQEARLRGLEPEQVLNLLLPSDCVGAASLLDRLSFGQRNALIKLILSRLGYEGILMLPLGPEPDEHLLWLLWYAMRLHLDEPSAKKLLAEDQDTPVGLTVDLGDKLPPQPRNSRGEPINLAGPILVKAFDVLTGLPNNQIPAPAKSDTRLGRTFSVDPGVIARWKSHPEWENLHVAVEPDGKGGVRCTCDLDAVLRSGRIVTGQKRGPNDKSSPNTHLNTPNRP